MRNLLTLFLVLSSAPALAYNDGRYACKNGFEELPDNIYDIKTVNVGGAQLPYIEVTRHIYKVARNPKSEMVRATIKGFGTVFANDTPDEMISIGAIKLQFVNGELAGCQK